MKRKKAYQAELIVALYELTVKRYNNGRYFKGEFEPFWKWQKTGKIYNHLNDYFTRYTNVYERLRVMEKEGFVTSTLVYDSGGMSRGWALVKTPGFAQYEKEDYLIKEKSND